jgi:leucyl-tRNA synthetase
MSKEDTRTYDARTACVLEAKWQERWRGAGTYHAEVMDDVEPFYVLDMFPFPSGAGLHVGHPLGFIGSDVAARFMRMRGKNVLHTMGFDAFGLPAEQYAIETNQHPEVSTRANIETYKRQIARLGLGHDERRTLATSDTDFYKWTQWVFLQVFNSFYDKTCERARPVADLVAEYEAGTRPTGTAAWASLSNDERADLVDSQRLAYRSLSSVNWCPGLGTVLADAEVTEDGRSERGDFPVFRKDMTQWTLRITSYASRLREELAELEWPESIKRMQRNWIGDGEVTMRDWSFSRQRYWGEPFPVVYDDEGRVHALPESMLPVTLPEVEDFRPPQLDPTDPSSEPAAPLGRQRDWVPVTLDLGDGDKHYRRETSTMPQWAGSSWYFLRYLDPENSERFVGQEAESYWMGPRSSKPRGGADLYVGGAEHAVLHLLYARFWHKVLFDLGHVSSPEPFARLFNQGYVQAYHYRDARGVLVRAEEVREEGGSFTHDGEEVTRHYGKMGKSLKNSVTPDEVCERFGADTFRVHQMSAAPLELSRAWETRTVVGSHRFLQKMWKTLASGVSDAEPSVEVTRVVNAAIKEARDGYARLAPNTVQAKVSVALDVLARCEAVPHWAAVALIRVVAPMAPHMCAELHELLGEGDVVFAPFPEEREVAEPATTRYPVQVNGKVRTSIEVPAGASPEEVEAHARTAAARWAPEPRRVVVVPGRIVNVVA